MQGILRHRWTAGHPPARHPAATPCRASCRSTSTGDAPQPLLQIVKSINGKVKGSRAHLRLLQLPLRLILGLVHQRPRLDALHLRALLVCGGVERHNECRASAWGARWARGRPGRGRVAGQPGRRERHGRHGGSMGQGGRTLGEHKTAPKHAHAPYSCDSAPLKDLRPAMTPYRLGEAAHSARRNERWRTVRQRWRQQCPAALQRL